MKTPRPVCEWSLRYLSLSWQDIVFQKESEKEKLQARFLTLRIHRLPQLRHISVVPRASPEAL